MQRNGQGLVDFGKAGFPKIGGSNKPLLQRIKVNFQSTEFSERVESQAAFTLHNLLKARKRSCRNPLY